jgi:ribosomal protein L7/L12
MFNETPCLVKTTVMFVSDMEDCTVIIEGWHPGFQKVSGTKLLQSFAGYSLAEAKRAVDEVLENKPVFVHFCNRKEACEFQEKIEELGADAQVID